MIKTKSKKIKSKKIKSKKIKSKKIKSKKIKSRKIKTKKIKSKKIKTIKMSFKPKQRIINCEILLSLNNPIKKSDIKTHSDFEIKKFKIVKPSSILDFIKQKEKEKLKKKLSNSPKNQIYLEIKHKKENHNNLESFLESIPNYEKIISIRCI
jgi:hypothetical protein